MTDITTAKLQSSYVGDVDELLHLKAFDSGREGTFAERREVK